MKAIWNSTIIAESNDTVIVENNHYFPISSLRREYVIDSDYHSTCPWKGLASYYSVVVDGQINENAAWYYPQPKAGAEAVTNRVAFWKGVQIVE
jgi:uncharacterized protein (DUF427 family)